MKRAIFGPDVSVRLREKNAIKGLSSLLAGFALIYTLSLVAMAAAVAAEIASAFVLRAVVDGALSEGGKKLEVFIVAAAIVVLAALARGVFSFFSARGTAHTAEGIAKAVREALFDHLQRLPFAYHDRTRTGELIQRATSDIDAVRRFYGDLVPNIARVLLLFALNFIAISLFNARLALLSSLILPAVAFISIFFFRKIFASYDDYQERDAKASAVLQENISGVRVVKAFARGAFEIGKYEETNAARYKSGLRLNLYHALYWPVSHTLCAAQSLIGWFLAADMTMKGTLSIGALLAYTAMLGGLIWPLQNLGRMVAQLSTATVSYGRLSSVLREERETLGDEAVAANQAAERAGSALPPAPVVASSAQPSPPQAVAASLVGDIVFDDVWFAYGDGDNPNWALKSVSFHAESGQRIALLGAPGSGKTTLVNLLPRFYEPSKGRILLDGRPLHTYPKAFLRERIGLVEQQPFLFSMTVAENIAYGAKRTLEKDELEKAATAAAIHASISAFPDGYATMVGERGVTLSGGQKQRVAIARTLVKDPSILILDDSTSAVDAETEDHIRAAMDRLGKRTTFVVAHKVRTLMDADLILVFRNGEIVERGNHAALIKATGFYAKAFDLQTRIEDELEEELRHEPRVS